MRKSTTQLDREIAAALRVPTKRTRHHATKAVGFGDLIRDPDPSAMLIAEDLLLEQNRTMREATGGTSGFRGRDFTFLMSPLSSPRIEWKMVQVIITQKRKPIAAKSPGHTWVDYRVVNGPVWVSREEKSAGTLYETRKQAVATGWAIAKALKLLPLDTDLSTVERIVDEAIENGVGNLQPEALF